MEYVTLTIDSREVSVPAGTTVLDAARTAGISIPTLCHDPELTNPGSCRLCIVEIENMRNLPPSCVTAVSPGMVVRTQTEQVREARKMILELLLANHPNECLTCERTGKCSLQAYAYEYGVDFPKPGSPFDGESHQFAIDDANPFIQRDMNKCILCGKCVRVCDEVQGRHVLDFAYRGFATKAVPELDLELKESPCVFCGSCVSVCPTGALVEKSKIGKGRPWEIKKVRTTCAYCGTGCNFDLEVKNQEVIGVDSAMDAPVNGRALCVKGRFGSGFIQHPDRLQKPRIKKDGQFVEASWEEALSLVGRRFQEIKANHGSHAFGVLASARATNEDNYVLNKFTRRVLGTNNIDHCARL